MIGERMIGFPRRLLFACVFFCFAATLNTQTFGLLLSRVASDTGISIAAMGGLRTLENVASIIVAILIAPHVDRFPRRWPLSIGFFAAILASLILWTYPTVPGTAAYLLLNGTAVMLCISTALAIPGDYLSGPQLSRTMGFMIAGFSLSEILFLPLAGGLADRFGWRSGFLLAAIVLFAGLVLALTVVPGRSSAHHAGGAVGLWSRYRQFLVNRPLLILLASALTRFAQYAAIVTFLSAVLITRFGLAVSGIGLIFSVVGVMSFSGSIVSGFVVHSGRFRTALVEGGLVLAILVFFGLVFNPGALATVVLILFAMFGLALQENASTLAVLDLSRETRGAAMSLNELSAASGALSGIGLGSIGLELAGVTGLGIVITMLGVIGSIGSWFALRRSEDPSPQLDAHGCNVVDEDCCSGFDDK